VARLCCFAVLQQQGHVAKVLSCCSWFLAVMHKQEFVTRCAGAAGNYASDSDESGSDHDGKDQVDNG